MYHISILKPNYLEVRENLIGLRDKERRNGRIYLENISFSNRYTTDDLIEA